MADRTLTFDIFAKDRASQAFQSAGRSSEQFGSTVKKVAGIAATAFAAVGVGNFLRSAIDEAREAQRVTRQTNAVLKSTGGVANVTGKQVDSLANRLSALAGVDDEVIASGENVLLTFTNIRNQVGKGNNVFDRATEAAVNMSAALGTDLQGSIIQVGKALNDPIKGVTALQRVGVSFTKDQKEQIKTLVESGRTLDAQKLILKELGTEFGGAAAATADPMARLGVVFKNVEETVGLALLPSLTRVANFLSKNLPRALDTAGRVFGHLRDLVIPVIAKIAAQWFLFIHALRSGFTENEGTRIESFALTLRTKVLPVVKQVAAFVKDHFKPILIGLGVTFALLTAPVTATFLGIVGAVIFAYARFQWFRDGIKAVSEGISGYWERNRDRILAVLTKLEAMFVSAFGAVKAIVQTVVKVLSVAWDRFGRGLVDNVKNAVGDITQILGGLVDVATGIFDLVKAILTGKWGDAWDAVKEIVAGIWQVIQGVVKAGIEGVRAIVETVMGSLSGIWSGAWHGISTVFTDIWDGIKKTAKAAIDWILKQIDKFLGPLDEWLGRIAGLLGVGSSAAVAELGHGIAADALARQRNNPTAPAPGDSTGRVRLQSATTPVVVNVDARGIEPAPAVGEYVSRFVGWKLSLVGGD